MAPEIAYLDAGIWISYGLGERDLFYDQSKDLIENRLGNQNILGIVSILSILESIDAIRRRITEKEDKAYLDRAYSDEMRKALIKAKTEEINAQLAGFLITQEKQMKLIFADFNRVNANQIIMGTYDFEREYFGIIRKYYQCGRCYNEYENYSYKGLGWIDIMHLNLAKQLHCNRFITTDQYYDHVRGNEEYENLELEIFKR